MNISQLSKNELAQYNKSTCSICGKKMYEYKSFEMLKMRKGRYILYCFFHSECLINTKLKSAADFEDWSVKYS